MTSPWPALAVTLYILLLCFLSIRYIPFCQELVENRAHSHLPLEGLRGFLALTIFIHHAVTSYHQLKTGKWDWPPYHFYTVAPQLAVNLFFIMTGFLFTRKIFSIMGVIPFIPFYLGRLKRLTPAYLASIALVLIAMALPIGNHSLSQLHIGDLKSVVQFAGLPSAGSINYVYWTLIEEWQFYLVVPILAFFARLYWLIVPLILAMIHYDFSLQLNFAFGGLVAVLVYKLGFIRTLKNPLGELGAIALMIYVFLTFTWGYGLYGTAVSALFFLLIACGNSLFGLLTARPVLLLGHMSYSLYLLHCPILYIVIQTINLKSPVSGFSEPYYWLLMLPVATVLFFLALLSYRWCEHPFLRTR